MSSVANRGVNRWLLRAHIGNTPTGQPIHKSKTITTHSKKHAEMLARQWELELRATGYVGAGQAPTLDVVADLWLTRIDLDGELEEWTRYGYRKVYDRDIRPALGGRRIATITVKDIDSFYRTLADRATSAPRYAHVVLRAIYKEAIRLGVVASSPLGLVSLPKRRRTHKEWPSMTDVGKVIEAAYRADPWRARFVVVAIGTGARRGELAAMRWSDVDGDVWMIDEAIAAVPGKTMHVKDPKTHQRRPVPLHPDVTQAVKDQLLWLEDRAYRYNVSLCRDPFLWSGRDDGSVPFKPDWLSHVFRLAAREAGVSATLHDCRHTFASWHAGNDTPLTDVQAMLGHGSLATTSIYLHGDTVRQRKAIDRMRLPIRRALGAAPEDRP